MKKHSLKFLLKLISKGFPKFKLKDPKVGSFLSNIASGRPSPKQTKSSPFLRKSSDVSVCQKKIVLEIRIYDKNAQSNRNK